MSKKLETEYKDYIRAEAPDLWERIEAGLTDKTAGKENEGRPETIKAAMSEETRQEVMTEAVKNETGKTEHQGTRKKLYRRYAAMGGSLVAAVVVVLLVSAVLREGLLSGGVSKNSTEMAAADMATMDMADEASDISLQEERAVEGAPAEEAEAETGMTENTLETADVVEKQKVTIIEKTEKNNNAIYLAKTENGETFTFRIAEDAVLDGKIEENNGLVEGEEYRIRLRKEGDIYVAEAISSNVD